MLSRDVPADSNQFYTRWCQLGYYYANSTCTSKWGILNQRCSVDSTAILTISLSVLVWALMQQECTSFLPSMPHRWSSRLTYFQSISFPIFKFMTESDTVHQSVHCDISSMCKGLYVNHWDCHNLSDYYYLCIIVSQFTIPSAEDHKHVLCQSLSCQLKLKWRSFY